MITPDDLDDELPPLIGTRFRDLGSQHIERYPPTEHHALRDGQATPAATGSDAARNEP